MLTILLLIYDNSNLKRPFYVHLCCQKASRTIQNLQPSVAGRGREGAKLPQFCKGDPLRSSSTENLLTKLFVIFLRLGTILGNDSADVASDSFGHQTGE